MSIEWRKVSPDREDYFINGKGPVVRAAPFGWWPADTKDQWMPAESLEEAKKLAERYVWVDWYKDQVEQEEKERRPLP